MTTMPQLFNPTGRKTDARVCVIADRTYYFSYQTLIAYAGPNAIAGGRYETARLANTWGPTTGRHFKELGCGDFPVVTDEQFERIVMGADDNAG